MSPNSSPPLWFILIRLSFPPSPSKHKQHPLRAGSSLNPSSTIKLNCNRTGKYILRWSPMTGHLHYCDHMSTLGTTYQHTIQKRTIVILQTKFLFFLTTVVLLQHIFPENHFPHSPQKKREANVAAYYRQTRLKAGHFKGRKQNHYVIFLISFYQQRQI